MHLAVARRFFAPSHNDANADDDDVEDVEEHVAREAGQGSKGLAIW